MTTIFSQREVITEILSNLSKFIKPLIAMWAAYMIIHKANLNKKYRGRQLFLPLVGAVYSLVAIIAGVIIFQKFDIALIWSKISRVGNAFLAYKGMPIRNPFPAYNGGQIVYMNIGLMAIYLIVRGIAKKILYRKFEPNEVMAAYADGFYEYSVSHANWFLRQEWRGFQRLFAVLGKLSVFITAGLLCFSWIYEVKTHIVFVIFPFVLIILTEEVNAALGGDTVSEYEMHIDGEDAVVSGKIGNFQRMLEIYKTWFSPQILSSHPGTDYSPKEGPVNYLDRLNTSESQVDQLAAHYFEQQQKENVELDVDYMHATVRLLHGNSVIITNPFYRDLSKYLLLPLVDALIKGYKCLVLIGEKDIAPDAVAWVHEMLEDYARVSGIWRVEMLDQNSPDCEVGILDFPALYDVKTQEKNREFFQNVAFCLLVETSNMIPTAQLALSMVVKEMNHQEKPPVYCVIDRVSDGLVDTFSHVLQTNITDVIAAPIPRCIYTSVAWDANGDYQRQRFFEKETRFLGNGTELATVAIKNQIPHVTWFGGRKAPVLDIEWIAGQYYPQVANYAHLIKQQTSLRQRLTFEPNYWQAQKQPEQFVIVEDQYCNIYETLRMFLSRGDKQSFVNVMSENYLLRDYMRYNMQMFMSDPKAVPSIVPDYARTERNTILQLILRMAAAPVAEHEVVEDLLLIDQDVSSVKNRLKELIATYTLVNDDDVVYSETRVVDPDSPTSDTEEYYSIKPGIFAKYFSETLKNAYFVAEEERFATNYIDAKMYGLITQCLLPGQFMVSGGKYYQVESINPGYGVLLRRASDRYEKRACYRQIRKYIFGDHCIPLHTKKIMDLEVTMLRRDFDVETSGYLDMEAYHDLKSARVVDFSKDTNRTGVLRRSYRNKNVLCIELPDATVNMRMTLSMLLQELFHTIYPDNWQYLAVLSEKPDGVEGMLNYMTYDSEGLEPVGIFEPAKKSEETAEIAEETEQKEDTEVKPLNVEAASSNTRLGPDGEPALPENCRIYIVEDSDLDLGLLESIENNMLRFFEILTDYLEWHFEKMSDSPANDRMEEVKLPEEERLLKEAAEKRKAERSKFASWFSRVTKKDKIDKERQKEEEEKKRKEQEESEASGNDNADAENAEAETGEGESSSERDKDKKKGFLAGVRDNVGKRIKALGKKKDQKEEGTILTPGDETEGDNASSDEEEKDTDLIKQTEKELETAAGILELEGDRDSKKKSGESATSGEEKARPGKEKEPLPGIEIPDMDQPAPGFQEEKDPDFVKDNLFENEDDSELLAGDGMPDDFDLLPGFMPLPKVRYRKECFLKFGFDEIDGIMEIEKVRSYLTARGLSERSLFDARTRIQHQMAWLDVENINECEQCDFCGMPLTGVSYERLQDGRVRCNDCAASAIESVSDFRRLFEQHLALMQSFYGITFDKPIQIRITDQRTISRLTGVIFRPTRVQDGRVLGYAQKPARGKDEYNLVLENGSPRLATIETMVHELTHIWQYLKWDDRKIEQFYGKKLKVFIYEGMAVWSAIQYLYLIGETAYAQAQESIMIQRALDFVTDDDNYDVYGIAFYVYRDHYPIQRDMEFPQDTPFRFPENFPPLERDEIPEIVYQKLS